jgi:hypothetical protein
MLRVAVLVLVLELAVPSAIIARGRVGCQAAAAVAMLLKGVALASIERSGCD